MTPSGVGVVVVNWNSFDLLHRCLEALAAQDIDIKRTVVIDNGSDHPEPELVCRQPKDTRYVRLANNIGFAAANNVAVRHLSDCEWIALVNPDAFPRPDWLRRLVGAAGRYPDYASFACRLVMERDPSILDGEGDVYHMSGLVWRDRHGAAAGDASARDKEVFSPCAAAALYRRDAFEAVGGFDEDFFCYIEDMDLGFRLRLAGQRCLLVAGAVVHHVGSAPTGGKRSDFAVYHGHRNIVWAFVKNMPGVLFWTMLPLHLVLTIATIAVFSLRGQGWVVTRAKWDALKGLPRMWRKRRGVQAMRRASAREIWAVLDKRLIR